VEHGLKHPRAWRRIGGMSNAGRSRSSLVALLVAVELLIVGVVLYSLNIFGMGSVFATGWNAHQMSFTADPIAPLAVGLAPDVQIDDPNSRIVVTASSDGLVHVEDRTRLHGWTGTRTIPQLHIERTASGVRIARPDYSISVIFGDVNEEVDVQIPSAAQLTIVRCAGAEVRGMRASLSAHSVDGNVALRDIVATTIDARTDDGSIEASDLIVDGAGAHATLHSSDGSMRIAGRFGGSGPYDFSTDDGSIDLTLQPGTNLAIDASTSDGNLAVDGQSYRNEDDDDQASHTFRLGNGATAMRLHTADGSIHITTT
jgi:hypothetical protein